MLKNVEGEASQKETWRLNVSCIEEHIVNTSSIYKQL